MKKIKKVLTIAGSDSGGGAGIQADLKTFEARGVYGMSVLTAITAQNTVGVQGVYELSPQFVAQQIDSVMSDIGADVWKIGMLANAEVIDLVAKKAKEYRVKFIILDPVMVAKSGDLLLQKEAVSALIEKLIPLAYMITPNLPEAEELTGLKVSTREQMKSAAQLLHQQGPQYVLIKGGHLSDQTSAIDILYDGKKFKEFSNSRIDTRNTHGTGCTLSSAIAAELAKGHDVKKAVSYAKDYVTAALKNAIEWQIGKGVGPLNHSSK